MRLTENEQTPAPSVTMMERVAEAIFLASGRAMDVAWADADKVLTILGTDGPQRVSDHFRTQARAVLEAMIVPTPAMREAVDLEMADRIGWCDDADPTEIWQRMICTALADDGALPDAERSGAHDK